MFKKKPSEYFNLQIKQARLALEHSNVDMACQILETFPDKNRKEGWNLLRAECHVSKKEWYLAIHCLKSVNTLTSIKYQNLLLHAYYNVRQYENAIRLCLKYHETMIVDKRQSISFAKLARMTNNSELTLEALEFVVRKFPNYIDLNIHLIEHCLAIKHPNSFPLLMSLISTAPYQLKYHILYVKWAIQNQHFFYAHMSLLHLLYTSPMFLTASHQMVRLFALMNCQLMAELTYKQMLFRHGFSRNAVENAEILQEEFPYLNNVSSIELKVTLYPELNHFFSMLNAHKHRCYLVGSTIHQLIDLKPLNEAQDIDFVVDFNPRMYHPFHQSFNNPQLFSADIPDSNLIIRNVDCFYMDSEQYPTLNMLIQNRDFTMNALLCDVQGNIVDPTNLGIQDYQHKILRTVQPSRESLEEDPVRILRVMKYLLQGFKPTDELQYAVMNWKPPRDMNMSQMIAMARKIYLTTEDQEQYIHYLQVLGLQNKIFGIDYEADSYQIQRELEGVFFSNPHLRR